MDGKALLCGLLLLLAPTAINAQTTAASASPARRLPTFGVMLIPPAGWTEAPRERPERVVQWSSPGTGPNAVPAMIVIEAGHARARSLDATARGFAKDHGGKLEKTTLAASPAYLVVSSTAGNGMQPRTSLIAQQGGLTYMVVGLAAAGRDCRAEIEALRKSWSWIAIESPARHLQPRAEPYTAFAGRALVNLPELVHIYPSEEPDRFEVAIQNPKRDAPDFVVTIERKAIRPGMSTFEQEDRITKNLKAKFKLADPPAWQQRPGTPARFMTQAVRAEGEPLPKGETSYVQVAVVPLDGTHTAVLNFTMTTGDAEERKAYERAAQRIVDSLRPAGPIARAGGLAR